MKATLVLFVCLFLGWHLSPGLSTPAASQNNPQQAEELLELSDEQNLNNHEAAVQTAKEALALFQSAGDQTGVGKAHVALAQYFYALNKMNESARNNELAIQIWREQHDLPREADAL